MLEKEERKGGVELKLEELILPAESETKYKTVVINEQKYLEPNKPSVKFITDEQIKTLGHCLSAFFNKEVLSRENGNAFACPKCDAREGKDKKAASPAIREYFIADQNRSARRAWMSIPVCLPAAICETNFPLIGPSDMPTMA